MEDDDEVYEPSDSEDDYSKEDKILIENAKESMRVKEASSDEEVYGLGASDSEDEDEDMGEEEEEEGDGGDIDMADDLEDEERLPDERAWGQKKEHYYNTDFVDRDYDGMYEGIEAENAELEEQEAKNIQKRLLEQLNDADFSISEAADIAKATETTKKKEVIESDLSKLSKRQKLDLLKKESPEFIMLVEDFKEKMEDAKKFLPVINYFNKKVKTSFPALEFLQTKLSLILNYCTNISFYLLLKAKRVPIKNHPVLKSLFKYRQLLQQIEAVDRTVIKPQVKKILEIIESGEEVPIGDIVKQSNNFPKPLPMEVNQKETKKQGKNNLLKEMEKSKGVVDKELNGKEDDFMDNTDEKRAITYKMAKNKGLLPKRSKEQRNPRVKYRKKYERTKKRRKGQVQAPRSEIPVYGGERTGIKIELSKSTKLKF